MSRFDVAPQPGSDAHAWLLTVAGEFDLTATEQFDRVFDDAVAHGARLITIDLTEVTFLDSSGLRSVITAANRLTELDGHLTVAGLSGAAQQVLEITGLIDRLTGDDA